MSTSAKHIVIITGQHMVANPRVWKEANSLSDFGFRVTILTTIYDAKKLELDKVLLKPFISYKASVNLIKEEGSVLDVFFSRIIRRGALLLKKIFNVDTPYLLLYRLSKQVKCALDEDADLYIAHQEAGLIIGNELLKKGKKVAFDIEDWYSKDYLNFYRPVKLLVAAEYFAILNGSYITCPSETMANRLQENYSSTRKPKVIYNAFMHSDRAQIQIIREPQSLVWFSQVIGIGRGLETLTEALLLIEEPYTLHLIGEIDEGYKDKLVNAVQYSKHKLVFHGTLTHQELILELPKYEIGLAIELKEPENRNVTITNKILQYLEAGNKILATDTEGQTELAVVFSDSIKVVEVEQPLSWAAGIQELSKKQTEVNDVQASNYREKYSWDAQGKKLNELVENALNGIN